MQAILLKAAPWALLVLAGVVWFKTAQARAREAGRAELMMEQRDSVLAVHEEFKVATRDSVATLQVQVDTIKVVEEVMLDSIIAAAPDTVWAERVRTLVDTIRVRCYLCEQQRDLLGQALTAEEAQHQITRNLLAAVRQKRDRWITVGVTLGVSAVYTDQLHVGPGVTAGVQLRIF